VRIDRIVLHRVQMPLVMRFETSFGVQTSRIVDLVEMHGGGQVGWGEGVALTDPVYNEENVDTARLIMTRYLIPRILGQELTGAAEVSARWAPIRGNRMAKAALECAAWDLEARLAGVSLAALLGGTRDRIPVGVSLGIERDLPTLLAGVDRHVAQGYRRIKLKVKPGWDERVLEAVRDRHPDVPLSVDANTAYSEADIDRLASWERFHLEYIEQPFGEEDWLSHAALQRRTATPVCLDESVTSVADARLAVELEACRVINCKVGRVGGLGPSLELVHLAHTAGLGLWCGGMLETGIGRLVNVAITSLDAFTHPGDTAASARYWAEDLIDPPVTVEEGTIRVPQGPGLGHAVLPERIARHEVGPAEVFEAS
jgi:O-succinylbenzoate synthase